jgi:hypothetical protein
MEKKPLVLGKDIRPSVVPAMAIAEKDDPRGIVKGHPLCRFKDLCQSLVCTSARLAPDRARTPPRQRIPLSQSSYHSCTVLPSAIVVSFYHLLRAPWVKLS